MTAAQGAGTPTGRPDANDAYRSLGAAHHPDWLGGLPDGLTLGRLSVPGTHDTMAFHGDKAGPAVVTQQSVTTGCGSGDSACVSRRSLRAQFDAGIRALDIRVRRDENDGLALQHGSFYQQAHLDDVLTVADQFLADHPRETVLMRVKAECDNTGKPFTCDDAGRVPPDLALIDRYLTAHPRVWQPSVTGRAALPALGEVRGRIVLTQFDNIAGGDGRGLPLDIQDDWHDPSVDAKWAAITAQLDKAAAGDPHTLYLNFLSASGVPDPARVPERYAHDENPRTLDRLRAEPGKTAGLLMADFPGSALIDEIIRHNQG
ncbi:phosphatidylinositol-specific phospholipase C [Nocardia sp. BMG111209]|uniref:phosphatidylinositol-specific phospholipase C n=1 Tax=Nocardia sp. BMG111209 TaxID=1160137 RepID=UPI0003A4D1D2|nr:phosphatidylinositol-specific phospholipase C [Nocardia sp. BMG111209]